MKSLTGIKTLLLICLTHWATECLSDESIRQLDKGWQIVIKEYTRNSDGTVLLSSTRYPEQRIGQVYQGTSDYIVVSYSRQMNTSTFDRMIYIKDILGHVTLKIDDQLALQHGDSFSDGTKSRRGDLFFQLPSSKAYKLTIEVNNSGYAYRGTGIYQTPYIGSVSQIKDMFYSKVLFMDLILIGILSVSALYHFLLYFLRRANLSALILGSCSLVTMIRMLFASQSRIIFNFTDLPTTWTYYIENSASCMILALFYIFPAALLKEEKVWKLKFKSSLIYKSSIPIFVLSGITLIPVPAISDFCLLLMQYLSLPYVITILAWATIAAIRSQPQARLLCLGYFVLGAFGLLDVAMSLTANSGGFAPIGLGLFIIVQAGLLSIRFNNLFIEVDTLNGKLEQQIIQVTNSENTVKRLNTKLNQQVDQLNSLSKEQVRLNQELTEKNMERENKLFLVSQVAHRLNNPLNYIKIALFPIESYLQDEFERQRESADYQTATESINFVKTGIDTASKNIEMLRSLSGVDGKQVEMIHVQDLIALVQERLKEALSNHDLPNLKVQSPEDVRICTNKYALVIVLSEVIHCITAQNTQDLTLEFMAISDHQTGLYVSSLGQSRNQAIQLKNYVRYLLKEYSINLEDQFNKVYITIPTGQWAALESA